MSTDQRQLVQTHISVPDRQRVRAGFTSSLWGDVLKPSGRETGLQGKALAWFCLDTPQGTVQVYDTHTCANYGHSYRHIDVDGEAAAMFAFFLHFCSMLTSTQHA